MDDRLDFDKYKKQGSDMEPDPPVQRPTSTSRDRDRSGHRFDRSMRRQPTADYGRADHAQDRQLPKTESRRAGSTRSSCPTTTGPAAREATDYRENIKNCNGTVYDRRDADVTEPGNMVGPTKQGVDGVGPGAWAHEMDPGATWNAATNRFREAARPVSAPTARIRHEPPHRAGALFDIDAFFAGSPNGKSSVTITNMIGFFIEGMGGIGQQGRHRPARRLSRADRRRRATSTSRLVPAESAIGAMSSKHMATHLIPEVLVVGPLDRELEQLLGAGGMRATRAESAELTALAHPSARPPEVVVLDIRDGAPCRRRWPR